MAQNHRIKKNEKAKKNIEADDDDFENTIEYQKIFKTNAAGRRIKTDTKAEVEIDNNGKLLQNKMCSQQPSNILTYFFKKSVNDGKAISNSFEKVLKNCVVHDIKRLAVKQISSPFDRRITALVWHPKFLTTLAVGSKGGDIFLWNHNHPNSPDVIVKGSGAGGSIQAMQFDTEGHLYTCSIDGTVCFRDLNNEKVSVYLNTGDRCCIEWYTSLDVSPVDDIILAGDNKGNVNLLTKSGSFVWKKHLHKGKVLNIEFSKRHPWLFATASLDNYVRLWDVRKIGDANTFLASLEHEKGVNSAYFSPCHGTQILTTDQHSKIKIFSGPLWSLETKIIHPHRQFQHLTPIKADWHPLEDIVVVGRYPDPKMPGYSSIETRSVDFYDAADGALLYQLESVGHDGIKSFNRFDSLGNAMASAMGQHVLLWKPNDSYCVSQTDGNSCIKMPPKRQPPRNNDEDENGNLKKKKRKSIALSTAVKNKKG